jgi:hypothetical protein
MNLALRSIFVHTSLTCRKILRHGADGFTSSPKESESRYNWRSVSQSVLVSSPFWDSWPLQKKACCGFLCTSAGFESANLGSNGKHTNHYKIEDDLLNPNAHHQPFSHSPSWATWIHFSTVSYYRLDDRATAVRSPAQQRTFPLASVSRPSLKSTQSPIQWVLCSFRGGKARSGRDADHSPPSNAEVPLVVCMAVAGQLYFIIIIIIRCIAHNFSSLNSLISLCNTLNSWRWENALS